MSGEHILVVDDEADIRAVVHDILDDEGYSVDIASNAEQARSKRLLRRPDLVLLDIWMPDTDGITLLREWAESDDFDSPVVMLSGHGTVDTAMEATRLGAADFLEKPLSLAKLLDTIQRALAAPQRIEPKPVKDAHHGLIPERLEPLGTGVLIDQFRDQLQRAAEHDVPVLLAGEPGSGRGMAARYIHSIGHRCDEPFVNVVPAAFAAQAPAALLGRFNENEVTMGAIAKARAGMVFIDEVADFDDDTQRLLVGIMDSNDYLPVGAVDKERVACRIMASTRPDITRATEAGRLRRDLVDTLGVLVINVPSLREYRADVPDLLRYFTDRLVDQEDLPFRRFSVAAQNRLRNYPWPGNLRELRNIVRRFLTLGNDGDVTLAEVDHALASVTTGDADSALIKQDFLGMPLREAREQFERAYLRQQLKLADGKVGKLAERVGLERTNLYRKLRSLGIEPRSGRH